MNYELATELSEAGWDIDTEFCFNPEYKTRQIKAGPLAYGYIPAPSLSELIEACGEGFGVLEHTHLGSQDYCTAGEYIDQDGNVVGGHDGSTPEEAVARLWLALNAKT